MGFKDSNKVKGKRNTKALSPNWNFVYDIGVTKKFPAGFVNMVACLNLKTKQN